MFACVACGDPAGCFPAPPWLRALVPTATHIAVSDATAAPGALASGPHHDASRPVLMACPAAGASLKLASDTARTLSCAFCKNDVYSPTISAAAPPAADDGAVVRALRGPLAGQIARNAVAKFEAKEEERREVEQKRGAAMSDVHAEAVAEIEAMKEADAAARRGTASSSSASSCSSSSSSSRSSATDSRPASSAETRRRPHRARTIAPDHPPHERGEALGVSHRDMTSVRRSPSCAPSSASGTAASTFHSSSSSERRRACRRRPRQRRARRAGASSPRRPALVTVTAK